jgi:alanyl-tRNA synthetase
MGLERIAAILQGVHSNFETDMFQHLIKAIADMANTDPNGPLKASHNVVADHLRAICFLIADGVLPSNEGRGYVLRRIMRRAMRHAYLLGVKEPMIYKLLPTLQQEMGEAYPELYARENLIKETIAIEEERFGRTLDKGMKLLDDEVSKLASGAKLSGETAFKLYDTYGFPLDLTQDALKAKNMEVDVEGFDACMEKQKAEARKNWAGSGDEGVEKVWYSIQDKCGSSEFLGYNTLRADAEITALVQDNIEVKEVTSGKFELVANQTPFYGECGGQVGDIGSIKGKNFSADVVDCKRKLNGIFVHVCELKNGSVKVGDVANFAVNAENRARICANHSVTHLAHKALKQVLGDHVAQKGSMVEAERMRFDISHPKQITTEQLREVERIVNEQIRNDLNVFTVIMNKDEAVKLGAMALFDEKYAEDVRVVTMGDESCPFSRELCGGTHVKHTGNIGYFHILSESAVAAGVRRLECVTGAGADTYVHNVEDKLHHVATSLKTNVNDLENRIAGLLEERKKLENEIFNLKKSLAGGQSGAKDEVETVSGIKFVGKLVPDAHPKELKAFVDDIMQRIGSGVVVLCSDKDAKASVVVGVSKDLTGKYNAVDMVRAAAGMLGGQGGGGRPDMAQAGGTDVGKIDKAISGIKAML